MKRLKSAVRRVVRLAAREFAQAVVEQQGSMPHPRVRIDIEDAVRQLSTREANNGLQRFFGWNHRWVALLAERNRRTAVATYDFIEREMPDALFVLNQFKVLEARVDDINSTTGSILDLGVYKGSSTRALARLFPEREIHGFDSFEGLPDDWAHALKGDFGEISGALPDVPSNVRLYKGWFEETLPPWSAANGDEPIALLRIDCDVYSSTRTIFQSLGHLIQPGTWIVFDELIGYRGWPEHEFKAFVEFLDGSELSFEFVAYGLTYTIVRMTSVDGAEAEVASKELLVRLRALVS